MSLLREKISIVTGAGKGIGRAVAELFAREGSTVYAIDVTADSLSDIPDEFKTTIIPKYFDITDRDAVKALIMEIRNTHGKLDVLVNNAALMDNTAIGMIKSEQMERLLKINVIALIDILQLAARVMQRQNSGSIINISSMVGLRGNKGQLLYSATKGAVIALTKSASKELAAYNIRVNSIAPGLTDTDGFKSADEKYTAERVSNIGMKRLAQPI